MSEFMNKPTRRRLLIPLTLTFVVLLITFVHIAYQIRAKQNSSDFNHRYQVTQAYTSVASSQRQTLMQNLLRTIADDPQLAQSMRVGNRDALLERSQPYLHELKSAYGINHFYFHTPEGHSFLRVYNPGKYGDKIERGTFLQAAHSGKFSFGLELGRSGTLTYRGVHPWSVDGNLLGYIEIGMELDQVLAQLKAIVKEDFLVTLDKSKLNRTSWEQGRKSFGRQQTWDLLPNRVIAYQTMEEFSISEQNGLLKKISSAKDDHFTLKINSHDYRVKGFPLIDFNDQAVGEILVMHDVTNENTNFHRLVSQTVLIAGGICLVLFIFAYNILGRMDRHLLTTRQQLDAEVANVKASNARLAAEIEQRTLAENALQQLNETLEMRVQERTATLEKLNHELKENQAKILHQDKMACIGQVAAGIAHDINNPVGFVSHNLLIFQRYLQRFEQFIALQEGLIKTKADDDLQRGWLKNRRDFKISEIFQELPEMLEECRDGTTRITQIVQGLRTFSRQDTPRHQLTDLHQCLDSTLALLRHELGDKIRVIRDYGDLPQRYCYSEQIKQVFMNLLINAAQASEAGGEIRIRSWTADQQIFISISDTGCSIAPEQLTQIFEPFYTTKPIGVGTGLGLSIVYDIVSRHQGEVKVTSQLGVGTTFTLQFPFDSRKNPRSTVAKTDPEAPQTRSPQGDVHV